MPEHCFAPIPHAPVQTPIEHVCPEQATGASHAPATHVCTPPAAHCVLPFMHTPHVPVSLQNGVAVGHAVAAPHAPVASHVSTPLPMHRSACGLHTPWHAPPTHALFVQAAPMFWYCPPTHTCGC